MYDVIIVGGGPAGITAGIYCQRANLKTVVFEKETIGGQIASSPLVKNFPGFKSISGVELANNFYEQAEELGLPIEIEEVLEITPGEVNKVVTDCGEDIDWNNIPRSLQALLASSATRNKIISIPYAH